MDRADQRLIRYLALSAIRNLVWWRSDEAESRDVE